VNLGRPQTIIVIARHLTDFYEFVSLVRRSGTAPCRSC
jgi:hypothetical protein